MSILTKRFILKFICLFASNFAICFNTLWTIMVCQWHVWDADNSLLWHGCDEILTVWELRKLWKSANHIIKLFKGSLNLSITAERAPSTNGISALFSLLLGSGVSMLHHQSSLRVRERCALTSAHLGRLRVAASVAPPPPPQVAPPLAGPPGWDHQRAPPQPDSPGNKWLQRGYRMGSLLTLLCVVFCACSD